MMNDHEKSHVVMQAWRFDLNAKDELSSRSTKGKNNQEKINHKIISFLAKIINE